jgi:hypothetical protein
LALAVLVPACDRLPCRPQHRVGHAVGRKCDRYAAVQQPSDRDAVAAENGKFAEHWDITDAEEVLRQLHSE